MSPYDHQSAHKRQSPLQTVTQTGRHTDTLTHRETETDTKTTLQTQTQTHYNTDIYNSLTADSMSHKETFH